MTQPAKPSAFAQQSTFAQGASREEAAGASAAIRIAVVGHTNAGKTSLLRTLTRRADFGEVSNRPGTTRHVERVELRMRGRSAGVQFFDTPGLEDAVALQEHVRSSFVGDGASLPAEALRRFLQGPEARGVFEQEAKVLRTLLDCDAAFLVIDVRTPILPKYRAEIGLLCACARPVLPVLNFLRGVDPSRETAWRALLADAGLHAVARFDATAPFTGAERELYQDLATLLPAHRRALAAVVAGLEAERAARRTAACEEIALLLVQTAAMRRTVQPPGVDGVSTDVRPGSGVALSAEVQAAAALQQDVLRRARQCSNSLLKLHGFRQGDAAEAPLPALHGRWEMDLFSPATLRDAGTRLGAGAASGAAVGLVADVAVGGLSLGAGMAIGAAVGGAVSQGWGPMGRRIANRLRGVRELTVEDAVILVLLERQLALARALEDRGHADGSQTAAQDACEARPGTAETAPPAKADALHADKVLRATRPARSRPRWEKATVARDPALEQAVRAVAAILLSNGYTLHSI